MGLHFFRNTARRVTLGGTSGLVLAFVGYKRQTDPIHIFWDLDHTILCSISPIPVHHEQPTRRQLFSPPLSVVGIVVPKLYHLDHIDDDFPYDTNSRNPNTRTYFRPGAMLALKLCNLIGTIHIYTAAQETYTNNIVKEIRKALGNQLVFTTIVHRDQFPSIVTEGKDLRLVGQEYQMQRCILFDDKVSNFRPQNYENGIAVKPFTSERVQKIQDGCWMAYLEELMEMLRLVGIAFWSSAHLSGDVRKVIVPLSKCSP